MPTQSRGHGTLQLARVSLGLAVNFHIDAQTLVDDPLHLIRRINMDRRFGNGRRAPTYESPAIRCPQALPK